MKSNSSTFLSQLYFLKKDQVRWDPGVLFITQINLGQHKEIFQFSLYVGLQIRTDTFSTGGYVKGTTLQMTQARIFAVAQSREIYHLTPPIYAGIKVKEKLKQTKEYGSYPKEVKIPTL